MSRTDRHHHPGLAATLSSGSGSRLQASFEDTPLSSNSSSESGGAAGSSGFNLSALLDSVTTSVAGEGGYDHEFCPAADARFVCPVCMLVMRRPIQTPCGHRFCATCIIHWIREKSCSDCPTCKDRLDEVSLFQDNFAHREILSLTVKCPNSKSGCSVLIELRNIQGHLNSECLYALCPCPNRCTAILLKKDIEHHLKTSCQSRKLRCTLCDESFPLPDKEHHLKSCPKMLEVCPLCGKKIQRIELKTHQDTDCPSKVVSCFFEPFGCAYQCTRENLKSHIDHETVLHLQLVGEELLRLRKLIASSSPTSSGFSPFLAPTGWSSESRNLLSLEPSENEPPTTPDLNLSGVHHADGTRLPAITMTTDRGFVSGHSASAALPSSSWTGLPLMSPRISSPAIMSETVYPRTARERELERTVSMLQRTVTDQATHIAVLQQKLGDLDELVARQNVGSYVWQITDIARRRSNAATQSGAASSATVHSPCFYTSATGYKLCLRVNLNGVDSGVGRFLAIFVHVNRGAFDNLVDWPFSGVITLRVIDQSDGAGAARQHIVENLEAKPGLAAFQRPLSTRNHRGFGFVEFAALSMLDDARYVRNDTLIIHAVAKETSLSSRT